MSLAKYFVLFLLFFPMSAGAMIFVNSSPFKANVYLNQKRIGKTPLVIRTNVVENLHFKLEKKGFYSEDFQVRVKKGQVTNFTVALISKSFSVQFPNRRYIILNGKKFESDHIQNLPNGYYRFEQDRRTIYARYVNPNRPLLYMSLGISGLGVIGGIVGILAGNEVYKQYESAGSYEEALKLLNTSLAMDNFALASFVVGGAAAVVSAYYFWDDWQVMSRNKDIKISSQKYLSEDRDLFERALEDMGRDKIKEALKNFNRILERFPESRFYPLSLLRRAEIYKRQGKENEALSDLEKLYREYPMYEIYELALKGLADSYTKLSKTDRAIAVYRELKQVNSLYPDYLVDYYYLKLLKKQWDQKKEDEIRNEIREAGKVFLKNAQYPDSFKSVVQAILSEVG